MEPPDTNINTWIGLVTLVVSAATFIRQWAREELARRQISMLEAQAAASRLAEVRAKIVKIRGYRGRPDHRLVIKNHGPAVASNVSLAMESAGSAEDPLNPAEVAEKLPIAELARGDTCSLMVSITYGMGFVFNVKLNWTNADGTAETRSRIVAAEP